MKRINQVAMAVVCTLCAQNALAQKDVDTVKVRQLNEVVVRIEKALNDGIADVRKDYSRLELLEDEIHRTEYEGDKLYVANQVLDNCLSALKHETMYYPSRIRQLIETNPDDVESLRELIEYYKSVYTMLSTQAMYLSGSIYLVCTCWSFFSKS